MLNSLYAVENEQQMLIEAYYYYFLYCSCALRQQFLQKSQQEAHCPFPEISQTPIQPVYINNKSAFNLNLSFNTECNQESKGMKSPIKAKNEGTKRSLMKISKCPHKNLKHYAKGMCSNCYHSKGRTKHPWKCLHITKPLYAKGLCQNCYQFNYLRSTHSSNKPTS